MAIEYTIPSIPTEYDGRMYRSRLEAKWAAFFDRCGWRFEYEPYDLGKWSPDFLLKGAETDILVEIKPITEIDVPTIFKMHTAAMECDFKGDLLLLGVAVRSHESIGWICSDVIPELPLKSTERDPYPENMKTVPWFVSAESMGSDPADVTIPFWIDRTRSGLSGDRGIFFRKTVTMNDRWNINRDLTRYSLSGTWKNAANAVQWHKR